MRYLLAALGIVLVVACAATAHDIATTPSNDTLIVGVRLAGPQCPLGHGPGKPIPAEDEIQNCQCAKWWGKHAPARLAFADCSKRERVEGCERTIDGDGPEMIYLDLKLYRCPTCGILFTEPSE